VSPIKQYTDSLQMTRSEFNLSSDVGSIEPTEMSADATVSSRPVTVKVPSFDDDCLSTFFNRMSVAPDLHVDKVEVSVDDFDELFINSNDM